MTDHPNQQIRSRMIEELEALRDSYSGGAAGGYYDRARERSTWVVIEALTRVTAAEGTPDESARAFAHRLSALTRGPGVSAKYKADTTGAEAAMSRAVAKVYQEVTGEDL